MIIAISGPAGVGKSTVAKKIARRFSLEEINAGKIFREMAKEKGMGLNEFQKLAEQDQEIDKMVDQRQKKIAREKNDVVLDAWLAGWMAKDYADIKVWLWAPDEVRMNRISKREDKPLEKVREQTMKRERSNKRRYREYYDIELDDQSIYDITLNTAKWSVDGVVNILGSAINNMRDGSEQ